MYKLRGQGPPHLQFVRERATPIPAGGRVPVLFAETSPLTDYTGHEFEPARAGAPPARLYLPRIYFDDGDELHDYLRDIDRECRTSIETTTRTYGPQADLAHYENIVPSLDAAEAILAQLARVEGMNIRSVGVLEVPRPATPPFVTLRGADTIAVVPGGAMWIELAVDFGEDGPPVLGSRPIIMYVLRFRLSLNRAKRVGVLSTHCLLVDDYAAGSYTYDADGPDSSGRPPLPLLGPEKCGFDDFTRQAEAGGGPDYDEVMANIPASVHRFGTLKSVPGLRTISLALEMRLPEWWLDEVAFDEFLVATIQLQRWARSVTR